MSAASDKQRHTVWWSAGAASTVAGMLYLRDNPGAEVTFIYNDAHWAEARYGKRDGSTARRVTVEEAAVLQGFPADHPWQGSKTSQFRQVGNSCCPAVSEAVLRSVIAE